MEHIKRYDASRFTDEDFRIARDSWRIDLCGDMNSNSLSVRGMRELLRMRDEDSEDLRRQMNRESEAPILFGSDAPAASGELKLQYDRVLRMALPYGTVGCRGYRSSELLSDVIFALDWLHDNMYGENVLTDTSFRSWKLFDWWDWYVGAACPLMDILMIIEDGISEALTEKYIKPVAFLRHRMRTAPTAAEAMSRIVTLTPLALITNDRDLLQTLFEECEMLLEEYDEGDNMRRDFCCMTHGMPYNIAYGVINLSRIGKVVQILSRSPLSYPLKNKRNLMGMMRYTFVPIMYRGRTLAPMNGRAMQYDNSAASVLRDAHYLFGIFGEDFDRELCEIIHSHSTDDVKRQLISTFDVGTTLEEYRKINSIPGTRFAEAPKSHIYSYARYYDALSNKKYHAKPKDMAYMWYSGDICVQHKQGCMVGLRMPSSRSYGYECMNGDNGDGWYTGEGALYLYTPTGEDEYSPKWWSYADKHLIPGTTVDDRAREIMFFNKAWKCSRDFVGGVSLDGQFVTAAMDYEAFHNEVDEGRADNGYGRSLPVYHCTLTAQKSWFFFDRAIVATGTCISAHDGYSVRTVIENRMLGDEDYVIIDGNKIDYKSGEFTLDNAERVYIPCSGGYFFPNKCRLAVRFYENEGVRFVSIWIDHGIDPQNENYEYILLPNASIAEFEIYDVDDIEVLRNDGQIQAASEMSSGLCGVIFREKASFKEIHAEQPMIIMLRKDKSDNIVSLNTCDPTQKLESFAFSIDNCSKLASADNCISIVNNGAQTQFTVTCDSARGRGYYAKNVKQTS